MAWWGQKRLLHKETRRINADIKHLKKLQAKVELRGCASDRELRAKENELDQIRRDILTRLADREKLWAAQATGELNRSDQADQPPQSDAP